MIFSFTSVDNVVEYGLVKYFFRIYQQFQIDYPRFFACIQLLKKKKVDGNIIYCHMQPQTEKLILISNINAQFILMKGKDLYKLIQVTKFK